MGIDAKIFFHLERKENRNALVLYDKMWNTIMLFKQTIMIVENWP